jgi:Acetyltransferase (GNAT) domain
VKVSRIHLDDFGEARLTDFSRDRLFTSPGWASLWQNAGGRVVVWAVEDQGEIEAILPGVEFGRGFATRFFSMPDGCYGGVLYRSDSSEGQARLRNHLLQAVARRNYLRAWIFDFYDTVGSDNASWQRFDQNTTLVDISDPQWEPPDRKLVSQIQKARREGISIRAFDWQRDHEQFLRLMHSTERRHGTKARLSAAFYRQLAELSYRDARVVWQWCEWQGKGACSHIYVVENRVLQGWRIDFDKSFSFLKPNQFIRFHTCREMSRLGIYRLNLGGTPERAPGLRYYKQRWGGEPILYSGFRNESHMGRALARWRPHRV